MLYLLSDYFCSAFKGSEEYFHFSVMYRNLFYHSSIALLGHEGLKLSRKCFFALGTGTKGVMPLVWGGGGYSGVKRWYPTCNVHFIPPAHLPNAIPPVL